MTALSTVTGRPRRRGVNVKVGIPREVKNHEYRVAITPAGVHELVRARPRGLHRAGAGVGSSIPDDGVRRGRRHDPARPPTRSGARADLVLKVKEPIAEEHHRHAAGPGALHLPAPGAPQGVHRRPARPARSPRIAYETVELADRALPLLAPDVRGGRPAGPAGRRPPPDAAAAAGAASCSAACPACYAAKVVVIGAGVSGLERRRDRPRHAAEVTPARPRHQQAAPGRRDLPGPPRRPSRPTPSRSSRPSLDADLVIGAVLVPGRQGAEAGLQRAGLPDEAGQRPRRHRDRPGRLLRGLAPDHARRPDLQGPQRRCSTASPTCRARCPTPRTYALTNVTLPYVVELANRGWRDGAAPRPGAGDGSQHPSTARSRTGRSPSARDEAPSAGRGPGLTFAAATSSAGDAPGPSPACCGPHLPGNQYPRRRAWAVRLLARFVTVAIWIVIFSSRSPRVGSTTSPRPRPPRSPGVAALRDGDERHPPLSWRRPQPGPRRRCAGCTVSPYAKGWPPTTPAAT